MCQQDVLCRWGGEELLILLPETGPTTPCMAPRPSALTG
ncbi:hypothetical protein [Marinobacter sp.]